MGGDEGPDFWYGWCGSRFPAAAGSGLLAALIARFDIVSAV
jgi:hypothetical protein